MARTPEETINTSQKFRDRITEIIAENDCNKKNFAALVGVSQEVIIRATKYSIIPSVKTLIKIADTLNLPIIYILGESDSTEFERSLHSPTFHTRLQELIDETGTTYSELSKKMPFAHNSKYEWERTNGLPSLDYLQILAAHFKVSIDFLLGRTDYKY